MKAETSTAPQGDLSVPQIGISCIVRNRPGVILDVLEFPGELEKQYLVTVSYKDSGYPETEQLLWNIEPGSVVLPAAALPEAGSQPMPACELTALVRACRWNASRPYILDEGMEAIGSYPVSAPFYGTIQPDDYQLVPLLKALRMPRVNMMIADDVGLGKTIEAGLIVNELLIRRRVNRILILCPASLRLQWRDEMLDKFSLPFEVVDSDSTLRLKRDVGLDANPWRFHNRIIASYHYLKQSLIFEQFQNALSDHDGTAQLPWDLLIVDEVHNLMPSPYGKDSDLCQMLRRLAPMFEHKIFLTATPHNGNTRCFSGLLEILDPARFRAADTLTDAEKNRVRQVVVRRMKSEINQRTEPPKFSRRNDPQALNLDDLLGGACNHELALIFAVEDFKKKLRTIVAQAHHHQTAGFFAIQVLAKRLLSCPMTFIESWQRCRDSFGDAAESAESAEQDLVGLSAAACNEITDDREAQVTDAAAASRIGAWLRNFAGQLTAEISAIDKAIAELGIDLARELSRQLPNSDARFERLCQLVRTLLMDGETWQADERLVVFTEYKTTQDYLLRRLAAAFHDQANQRIAVLYGGMDDTEREIIKRRFNDEQDSVRILIATDAASEGLNLQETARYLLHFDCPWNPSRLEQRNGRLDRHGQARDVTIYHFTSTDDENLRFMSKMLQKIHQVREDLGSCGKIFGEGIQRQVVKVGGDQEELLKVLGGAVAVKQQDAAIPGGIDNTVSPEELAGISKQLQVLAEEMDIDDTSRHEMLQTAMNGQCTAMDGQGCFRLTQPNAPGWRETIDEAVRYTGVGGRKSLPQLTFSVAPFLLEKHGRKVFRSRCDVRMLHLGHPLMRRAAMVLGRRRYPGADAVSRWSVRLAELPPGTDAVIRVHLEEMAVNQLRETFHSWVRTMDYPVVQGELQQALPHASAYRKRLPEAEAVSAERQAAAQELYADMHSVLRKTILAEEKERNQAILEKLSSDRAKRLAEENHNFQSREGELSQLIRAKTVAAKQEELAKLKAKLEANRLSPMLFDELQREEIRNIQEQIDNVERALRNDQEHYDELRLQLQKERTRIVDELLPRRYAMDGAVKLYPIAVEVIIPQKGGN